MTCEPEITPEQLQGVEEDARAELLRAAEETLRGTVTLGIAADQRAASLTAGFAAAAVGAGAASVVPDVAANHALLVALLVLCAFLAAATMCAIAGGRAIDFHIGGYEPRDRLEAAAIGKECLERDAIIDLQRRIDSNRCALRTGATRINRAIGLACASVVFAFVAYAVTERVGSS
jgi:hypothetical protein